MSNVININNMSKRSKIYNEALADICTMLDEFYDHVMSSAINLAVNGKWKKWNDSVPEGTVMTFSEEMLLDTGDINITELAELCMAIDKTRKVLFLKDKGYHCQGGPHNSNL